MSSSSSAILAFVVRSIDVNTDNEYGGVIFVDIEFAGVTLKALKVEGIMLAVIESVRIICTTDSASIVESIGITFVDREFVDITSTFINSLDRVFAVMECEDSVNNER